MIGDRAQSHRAPRLPLTAAAILPYQHRPDSRCFPTRVIRHDAIYRVSALRVARTWSADGLGSVEYGMSSRDAIPPYGAEATFLKVPQPLPGNLAVQ